MLTCPGLVTCTICAHIITLTTSDIETLKLIDHGPTPKSQCVRTLGSQKLLPLPNEITKAKLENTQVHSEAMIIIIAFAEEWWTRHREGSQVLPTSPCIMPCVRALH